MGVLHRLRLGAQKLGIDILRYPESDPLNPIVKLMHTHGIDLVVDVGANDGGFASAIRRLGYSGSLLSLEPLSRPFGRLRSRAAPDPLWHLRQVAVGDHNGTLTINVAGNAEASSSALPMLDLHKLAAPSSAYIGVETVEQCRLDDLLSEEGIAQNQRIYLKLDVQGFEGRVLEGARNLLASPTLRGLQMELSFVPLYEGAINWRDGLRIASAHGMTLMRAVPGFTDMRTGQMLQADVAFYRSS